MKTKLLLFVVFLLVSCTKEDQVIPDPPPPPPPPAQAEITVKFSPLPADCIGFYITAFGFFEESGEQATNNLKDEAKYPEFTYKFSAEFTEKYLGKNLRFYFRACREFPPGACWEMEVIKDMKLELQQTVFVDIPPRD